MTIVATLAQEESHTKSEIGNASIEARFKRGIFLTPVLLGYDHDDDGNLIVNEEEPSGEVTVEEFSYEGYVVVRGVFFAHLFEPSVTFNDEKVA